MNDSPCDVCGKSGIVQGLPGSPASVCRCPEHAPAPVSPVFSIVRGLLILAILALLVYRAWRFFTR